MCAWLLTLALDVQLNTYESLYGFSGVLALVGSNANSDGGLTTVYETKDAQGVSLYIFILLICPSIYLQCVGSFSRTDAAQIRTV